MNEEMKRAAVARDYDIAEEGDMSYAQEAQRAIHGEVQRLDKQVAELSSLISDLGSQLAPVRNSTPENNTKGDRAVSGGSPLMQQLSQITDHVLVQQERLTVLLSELEV